MKLVVQRVKYALVKVDGNLVGKIDKGFMVLVGITHTDTKETCDYLAEKLVNLRVFDDVYLLKKNIDIEKTKLQVEEFLMLIQMYQP